MFSEHPKKGEVSFHLFDWTEQSNFDASYTEAYVHKFMSILYEMNGIPFLVDNCYAYR